MGRGRGSELRSARGWWGSPPLRRPRRRGGPYLLFLGYALIQIYVNKAQPAILNGGLVNTSRTAAEADRSNKGSAAAARGRQHYVIALRNSEGLWLGANALGTRAAGGAAGGGSTCRGVFASALSSSHVQKWVNPQLIGCSLPLRAKEPSEAGPLFLGTPRLSPGFPRTLTTIPLQCTLTLNLEKENTVGQLLGERPVAYIANSWQSPKWPILQIGT